MKNIVFILSAIAIILNVACEKEDTTSKPSINLLELGHENTKAAFIGYDLHIDAEIIAENKIDKISVEIHHKEEHDHESATELHEEHEWEFDSLYTKYSGQKNTIFHQDIDIPEGIEPGVYHFHFSVTDMEGYSKTIEEEITLTEGSDNTPHDH